MEYIVVTEALGWSVRTQPCIHYTCTYVCCNCIADTMYIVKILQEQHVFNALNKHCVLFPSFPLSLFPSPANGSTNWNRMEKYVSRFLSQSIGKVRVRVHCIQWNPLNLEHDPWDIK